jgi:hypothetical protein
MIVSSSVVTLQAGILVCVYLRILFSLDHVVEIIFDYVRDAVLARGVRRVQAMRPSHFSQDDFKMEGGREGNQGWQT